jgi:aminoglycoside 3-N-acetyltransferase
VSIKRVSRRRTFAGQSVAAVFGGPSTVGTVNDIDDVDAAVGCELELLDPVCRADPGRVAALLADDFVEIGKSGRVWSRDDVVAALAAQPGIDDVAVGPMGGQRIAAGLVVVRYTTHHHGGPATVHRTGWWRQTPNGWQCWFHQATVVPEPAGEAAAVARVDRPVTQADVEASLRAVGVTSGSTVIVHCSLSELGWVVGNAVAVVRALRSVVGDDGTIVMPAQTGLSDPSHWQAPSVPESWWPTIRANWPAFDPMTTPLRGMGAVAECFARLPGVVHSGHPAVGFIAQGPRAAELMSSHDLDDGLGDRSPLASLEAAGADIVLIGVGHGNNTALHLAEMRALGAAAPRRRDGVPMLVDGQQRWVEYSHVDFDESDFVLLGDAYSAAGGTEMRAPLGAGEIRRLPMRELVAFGTRWIAEHRLRRR